MMCVSVVSFSLYGASDYPVRVLILGDMWQDPSRVLGGTEAVVQKVITGLTRDGYSVELMGFDDVTTFKVPFIDEAYLVSPFFLQSHIKQKIDSYKPHHIFIPMLGQISYEAASYCDKAKIPFTAFYSVMGAEFMNAQTGTPVWLASYLLRSFLSKATNIVVPSPSAQASAQKILTDCGITKDVIVWPHGVDTSVFRFPSTDDKVRAIKQCGLEARPHPYYLFVGRVSDEKNIQDFLDADLQGTKIVVGRPGNGRTLEQLQKQYPEIVFAGRQINEALLAYYHASDIFFFPSKLDSFGLVLVEALAAGLPIVGYNIAGTGDVVTQGSGIGYLAEPADGRKALEQCANRAWHDVGHRIVTPEMCKVYASKFSWENAINQLKSVFV